MVKKSGSAKRKKQSVASEMKPVAKTAPASAASPKINNSSTEATVDVAVQNKARPAGDKWLWSKNYRVWEANRKDFQYPENWLEPDLRDDKSSIFQELESELTHASLTKDKAKAAFLRYVAKLGGLDPGATAASYRRPPKAGVTRNLEPRDILPKDDADSNGPGDYPVYNWELFFHVPLLIATYLHKNQRFEEAQKWFHCIFDPAATRSVCPPFSHGLERFWRVKPLCQTATVPVQILEASIMDTGTLQTQGAGKSGVLNPQVTARAVCYQMVVVRRYVDNLLAWGDRLFLRNTSASVNEAVQLYSLAADILGKRPESVPVSRQKARQSIGSYWGAFIRNYPGKLTSENGEYLSYRLNHIKKQLNGVAFRRKGPAVNTENGSWTDVNTHDPGITYLELLCYSLEVLSHHLPPNWPGSFRRPASNRQGRV